MDSVDDDGFAILQSQANCIIDQVEKDGFESLSPDKAVFFLTWVADGEINNGGFHAICYNSTGDYGHLFADAYREIGACNKAKLFDEFLLAFGTEGMPTDQPTRFERHSALNDPQIQIIDALDEKYYQDSDPIDQLLLRWVKRFESSGKGA